MKKKWLITGVCLIVIAIGIAVFLLTSRMKISTVPTNAEVWLDGTYLGDSPMTINILDFNIHRMELKFDKAMRVVYDFNRFSMLRRMDVTSSDYYGNNEQAYTADKIWKLETGYDGVFLVNLNDPTQRKPIIEYKVEEDPINLLAPPIRVSISPKGEYAMMVSWLTNATEAVPAFWLVPVGAPDKRIEVFSDFREEINDAAMTRLLDMGFSPDSKWIWITTNEHFVVASIEHPEKPVVVFDDLIFSWSTDGQWLALSGYSEQPAITTLLQNVNGEWKIVSDNIPGRPEGFSKNGRFLWTFSWYISPDAIQKSIYGPVRLVDLETNVIVSEIDTEDNLRGISTPKESAQGNLFAFEYSEAFSQDYVKMQELSQDPNRGNLMITDKDGKLVKIISTEDYSSVAYWLPDGKHLAAVVDDEFGYYIKIVNIQDK